MTPAPLNTHRQIQEPLPPSYMHHPPPTSKPSPLHYHPPVKPWSLFTAPPHKKRPGPPRGRSHNRAIKVENRISKLRTPEPKSLRVFSGLLGGGGLRGVWGALVHPEACSGHSFAPGFCWASDDRCGGYFTSRGCPGPVLGWTPMHF